jgi:ABC-type transport system involved in multi-copper enzyme maturation permease subunit
MGIYKQSYRKFEGKRQGRIERIFTILRFEFIQRLKNKWILILLLLSWSIGVFPIFTGGNFMAYFVISFIWLLLFTAIAGGPILSEDFQYNAITLYLSRPLQRLDYFLGKYFTLFCLISLMALVPNIFIAAFIIGVMYDTPISDFDYYRFAYSLIGIGLLMTFIFTNIGMAFSATTKNHKYASGGIFAFIFFSNIISLALSNLYDDIIYCSIWANFMIIFSAWIDVNDNGMVEFDWNISFGILMLISIFCLVIVWLKIKRAEISE